MAAGAAPAPDATFYVRRCDPDDVDTIVAMYERTFHGGSTQPEWFARFHGLPSDALGVPSSRRKLFVSLIETCFMSVTVEDDDGQIAGFVAMDDAPVQMLNAEGAGTDWESWFASIFPGFPEVDGTTSLWFSCCLLDPDYSATIMAEVLRTTFSTMHDLQHLLAYVPGGLSEEEARLQLLPFESGHFEELPAAEPAPPRPGHWTASSRGGPPQVLRCSRQAVISPLHIRMARVEDHDNLAAIFDLQSEVVTQVYGEYFLAELIEAQNEENKALVAEVDGAAVGLLCLTSDVDINVLAQCFQLDSYDNFLKPQYMRRVREHAAAMAAGQDLPLCSSGDYMQVALGSIDFEALLEGLPRLEDGRLTAVNLHIALQQQEFADEVGDAVQDFERGVMTLMWQMQWAEPMLEGGSLVETRRVMSCVQTFLSLDLEVRREIAQTVLSKWEEVLEIYRLTRDALWSQAAAEAQEEAGGGEAKEEDGEAGGGEQMDEAAAAQLVDTVVFFKALSVEEDGPFSQDFLAKLMMVLHWWTEEDLASPLAIVPDDVFRASLASLVVAEEGLFVSSPSSPSWLANMPQHAKDVFCINMCCLDQAYQTQALDFLLPAFSLYPGKDYCIITQPHTAPNTPLLNAFTIVPPQPQNTFGHVLFLIHRAALLGPPSVRRLAPGDEEGLAPLVRTLDEETQAAISEECGSCLEQQEPAEGEQQIFVADFDEQLVGLISLRVPPADVVVTLRCAYHLDDYLLVEHHHDVPNRGHVQLAHFVVNPLFQKYTRRLQQLALRKCGKTVLFMETDLQQSVPSIFRELLQVAPRRPPQLKKVPRKPPKVASFVNVEKPVPTVEDLQEEARQQLLRDLKQTKALSVITKKLLSETKIPVNARIVVVGASDCGLSFLESLLSIPHLVFNSLTLLAPGGLEYHHEHHLPLVAGTAAYSHHELRRIMLEFRVRILDSRMVQIDRQQRCCILHDGSMLPYDYLVVAAGLQDDALHSLKIRSWGVEHVTDGYRRVNGAMSVADPSIRDLLVEGGTLVKSLIWNPLSYAVVYGRSLHAYCVVQGLLMRKVPPTKILLVLPPRLKDASHRLPVDAFYEGDEVEAKIHSILASMGVQVFGGYRLLGIQQDNRERLKSLILEEHISGQAAAAGGPGQDESLQQSSSGGEGGRRRFVGGVLEEAGTTPDGLPQKMLACRIIITADSVNVDPDIFNSVHGNGLVYDGRLIVDHNFKTTDNAIFSAGSLCEFSRRFQRKNAMRYLRHDGFNGREVGAKLAQALLRILDPVNGDMVAAGAAPRPAAAAQQEEQAAVAAGGAAGAAPAAAAPGAAPPPREVAFFEGLDSEEASPEMLPEFYMPLAKGGFLPGNLHFYRIYACRRGELNSEPPELRPDQVIVTDTLDTANGTGHFCRLTVDSFGKVDSITYLGYEELQVESLWSLVGLSETFLNHLYLRWRDGDIPDVVEFLTDEWATALFHDRFSDFCQQIKLEMMSSEEVKTIINGALDSVNLKEGLSRDLLAQIRAKLPKEAVRAIQEHLLDYLRENTNHLKAYFLPENWVEAR